MARRHDQPQAIFGYTWANPRDNPQIIKGMTSSQWTGRQSVQRARGDDQAVRSPLKKTTTNTHVWALMVAAEL
eukprot:1701055-Pyramimonas_sp.AAC.1